MSELKLTRRVVLSVMGVEGGLLAASAVVGTSAVVATSAEARPPTPAFRLDLETETGQKLRRYSHAGSWFVLGTPGERYAIRVTNPTAERVEAVVSVDGRDAISGRRGNYFTERGYIVPAYGSVLLEGFRSSLEEVRTFRFAPASESYSARMGTPENVGIIGVAIFKERRRVRRAPAPIAKADEGLTERREAPAGKRAAGSSSPAPAPAPASRSKGRRESAGASNIGTEYGEARESQVVEVPFVRRAERPDVVLTVRYDDADGLTARGIELYPVPREPVARPPAPPQAFPGSRFAPPPP
ncbi:MAG TPA: hypothetical protein VFQ61_28715 [Polyangiaceae bacterium]|nr:hypothetical protein [Polyangiaceae bacterium]